MSNTWDFTVVLPCADVNSTEGIWKLLRLVQIHGFTAVNPLTNVVKGFTRTGEAETVFYDLGSAVTYLSQSGGSLQLWKGTIDILLSVGQLEEGLHPTSNNQPDDYMPNYCVCSLLVDGTHFRYDLDPTESMLISSDLQDLFKELCTLTGAHYGYSTDEYALEQFWEDLQIYQNIRYLDPPTVLFWLQYFSSEYAEHMDLTRVSDLGGVIRQLENGVLVQFFDHPWAVKLNKLARVNSAWHQHLEDKGDVPC
jgi:hypothetical protein